MQEAGFGEETSKTVGKVLQQGFDDVSDVKQATLRNVKDVADCFSVGADVVTMPPAIFGKMYNHILTDKGLQLFQDDWNSIKKD